LAGPDQIEDLFLVKFKFVSYKDAIWLTRKDITTSMGSMASAYITRYQNKLSKASERWSEDHVYNPAFEVIDRIFNSGVTADDATMFLCKWCDLPYDESTWETREKIEKMGSLAKITEFEERVYIPEDKKEKELDMPFVPFTESPVYKGGNTLRSYQLEGLNWLAHCYHANRNSILGDEMVCHLILIV
jgi:SNF2 family DNA or RNA helicase